MEFETKKDTVAAQYARLIELEPKLITYFVPSDAAEQKQAFLNGDTRNPDHDYDKLTGIDFDGRAAAIAGIGESLLGHADMNPKHASAYREFVDGYLAKTRFMELAMQYKQATDPAEKAALREEYMQLNIEMYGAPDRVTYQSLLQEKLQAIQAKELAGDTALLRDELFAMLPQTEAGEVPERFAPSNETIEWMHEMVETLYGGMLAHVPEQSEFNEAEVKQVFEAIIREEFGDAAKEWKVDIEPAKSINVKSTEKRIVIPDDRGQISRKTLEQLVVHEVGVHMLRAVMGGETDLDPLANGLSDYYDAEEGMGKVMEQALSGSFAEAGIDHYITAGLSFFEGKDFRDTYEAKWRLAALSSLKDGEGLTEASVAKAKNTAYGGTMRMFRGTDDLPWFKDLSYYNGSVGMWRHLESIRGDDTKFLFVLLGKANPANIAHERIMYETASI
jgi:hypothetical protein